MFYGSYSSIPLTDPILDVRTAAILLDLLPVVTWSVHISRVCHFTMLRFFFIIYTNNFFLSLRFITFYILVRCLISIIYLCKETFVTLVADPSSARIPWKNIITLCLVAHISWFFHIGLKNGQYRLRIRLRPYQRTKTNYVHISFSSHE